MLFHNNIRAFEICLNCRVWRFGQSLMLDNIDINEQEFIKMASNKITVPEAKAALDKFKMQAASEVGVTLNQSGYNGDLTARQAGSIGGQMVKKMVESYENSIKGTK